MSNQLAGLDNSGSFTIIDTALGCPYGLAGEQAIGANDGLANGNADQFVDRDAKEAYLATAEEADLASSGTASAILGCETCSGNPHTVDLRGKVCAFAVEACTNFAGLPKDIDDVLKSRKEFGN